MAITTAPRLPLPSEGLACGARTSEPLSPTDGSTDNRPNGTLPSCGARTAEPISPASALSQFSLRSHHSDDSRPKTLLPSDTRNVFGLSKMTPSYSNTQQNQWELFKQECDKQISTGSYNPPPRQQCTFADQGNDGSCDPSATVIWAPNGGASTLPLPRRPAEATLASSGETLHRRRPRRVVTEGAKANMQHTLFTLAARRWTPGTIVTPAENRGHHRALVVAFFEFVAGESDLDGLLIDTRRCWPDEQRGDRLERALVIDGLFPSLDDSAGVEAPSMSFSLLETTLDPKADPSCVLYACTRGNTIHCLDGTTQPSVLCLVSRVPLFEVMLHILDLVANDPDGTEELLKAVNAVKRIRIPTRIPTSSLASDPMTPLSPSSSKVLSLFPNPLLERWRSMMGSSAPKFAQALDEVVMWGLRTLLTATASQPPIGDTLARLLAAVLLEQKVLLLGKAVQTSAMALVLRALLAPFRWLHPFLSTRPQRRLLKMPLLEATCPMVLVVEDLPPQWGYNSVYDLPEDVIVGVLQHSYVHSALEHQTIGCLPSRSIRLPDQGNVTKRITSIETQFRDGSLEASEAADSIRELLTKEVAAVADTARRYATSKQGQRARAGGFGGRDADDATPIDAWLLDEGFADGDTEAFFRTFFQTQMCEDFLDTALRP
eukprot:TRINITY_DN63807_c0_g1_i1.p1 TRINITY_DN63807_c0_g1~~TRINITY_DN63807_c0_g1_i1.p1  ORF type:complete len:661 (+),score=83.36 TRINITY_DN63807_c0_g1_i1:61-2043(+)